MRKVRAFCGKAGSGKDYSVKRLMMTKGFKKVAFADAIREITFKILGMPCEESMKEYDILKETEIINGLTFRNILENLGSAVRVYDKDFWAKTVVRFIDNCVENVAISDLRYPNEYWILKEYCDISNIDFKLIFCDYKSERYQDFNSHESAQFAQYLKNLGYKDQEYVEEEDIIQYGKDV